MFWIPWVIRGANPLWVYVNLAGRLFDDTYYMYVLQNTLPYIPADIFTDPDLSIPRNNPVQFLGNGTLPIDIFYEPNTVYRLEFRQHVGLGPPSQNDPLIYLVENYVPGTGGSTPVDTVTFASENQISNPQFSLVNFTSPFTFSGTDPDPIQVAPDWFLELSGTGTVTINQVALNNSNDNPSNAPYALRLTLTGWTANSVFLVQRFFQNGMLWANKVVSSAITAQLVGTPQFIGASLVDSNNSLLGTVLSFTTTITQTFNEFTGHAQLSASTNPDLPPAAYIDYKLALPSNIDIYVTSIQLIVEDMPVEQSFIQDSINRQLDHTFHYYKDELIIKPKDTILTGWDFSLNPWQIYQTALTTITNQCQYVTDQTILYQQTASSFNVGKADAINRFGLTLQTVLAGPASNKFAVIQYIDPRTIRQYWSSIVSSLVKARIFTTAGTQVGIKMRLIMSTSVPGAIGNTEPIVNMTGTDPVFSGSWTAYAPLNDPTYILPNAYSTTESPSGAAFPAFSFDGFNLPDCSTNTQTLGNVIYTTRTLSRSPQDSIIFDSVSLVPNRFAVESNPKTFDQVLRECQYLLETSYPIGTPAGSIATNDEVVKQQAYFINGSFNQITLTPSNFDIEFTTFKRVLITASNITLYPPAGGAGGNVFANLVNGNVVVDTNTLAASLWQVKSSGNKSVSFISNGTAQLATNTTPVNPYAFINFHYVADARLGLF